jgi:hypothetical protein
MTDSPDKVKKIESLLEKAKTGTISNAEKKELARLLGEDPKEYSGDEGTSLLVGIALGALIGILIAGLLSGGKKS